jgi:hypothetical protein
MPTILATEDEDWEGLGLKAATTVKSTRDHLSTNKELDTVVHACHPSYEGSTSWTTVVQVSPSINMRPYVKNN